MILKLPQIQKLCPASPGDNLIIDRYVWNIFDLQSTTPDTIIEINVGATIKDTITYRPKSDTVIIHLETYSNTCAPDTLIDTILLYTVQIDLGEDSLICYGDSIDLSVNFTNTGVLPYSYLWTPAMTLNSATLANPRAGPLDTTTYILNVTDKHNCPAVDSVKILVSPALRVDAGLNDTICYGDSLLISAQLNVDSSGAGPISYQWSPETSIPNDSNQSSFAFSIQSESLSVVVTDSNGCTAQDSLHLTVSQIVVDAGLDTLICLGDSAFLYADTTGSLGISPLKFSWMPANGLSDTAIFNPNGGPIDSTTYTITVEDQFGCSEFDTVRVNVIQFQITAGIDKLVCYGDSVVLDVDSVTVPGVSPLSFVWKPSIALDNDSIAEPIVGPLIPLLIKLVLPMLWGV